MAQLLGGTRIYGNATVDGQLFLTTSTQSSSTVTGALIVTGGIGIGGTVYASTMYENSARIVSTSTIKLYAATSVQNGTDTVITLSTTTGQLTVWNTSTLQSITSRGATTDKAITITNTTPSSSTSTGALVVTGGMGVAEDIYVGGQIAVATITSISGDITIDPAGTSNVVFGTGAQVKIQDTTAASSTATGALVVSGGLGVAEDVYVGGQIAVSTITSISGDITIDPAGTSNVVFGTGAQVKILDTTLSSSIATGALVVSGGVGVAEDVYVGGQIAVATITSISGDITIDPNGTSNVVFGTGAQVKIQDTTAASSTATGALVVSGGLGVAEDVYVGGQIAVSTITSISGNITIDPNGVSDVVFGTGAQVKINDTTGATTTATGALVVSGGVGVGGDLYIGGEIVAQKLTIQLTTITTTMVQTDDIIKTVNTTAATNTTTGALVVSGGAGIGGNVYVGGQIAVATITSIISNSDITIDPNGTGNVVFGTGAQVKINDTTGATTTATGALVVSGGVGVAEDIYVGGQIAVATITSIISNSDITIDPNGTGNVVFGTGAQVKINDVTAASSTITGALVVSGGVGVAEDIYVGGQIAVATITSIISNSDITIDPNGTGNVVFGTGAQVKINDVTAASSTITGALVVSGGAGVGGNIYLGGELRASGNITAYNSSDIRFKENVTTITNAIAALTQINGVRFDWTKDYITNNGGEDGYFVRKNDVGVIAQEIKTVLPEIVGTRDDGFLAVRYEKIIPLLIEAIKEQQTQIDNLKSVINQLVSKDNK